MSSKPVTQRYPINGETLLHVQAREGNARQVELILAGGEDINIRTEVGRFTPLHLAVEHKQVDVAQLLLDRGARVNEQDKNGDTCLHIAVRKEFTKLVELLQRYEANPNVMNNYKESAFFTSLALKDGGRLSKLLLPLGINMLRRNKMSENALHLALRHGHSVQLVEWLLKICPPCAVNAPSYDGYPLHYAITYYPETEGLAMVRLLVKHGADVEAEDWNVRTPLYYAIECRRLKMAKYLLIAVGANVDGKPNMRYRVPLFAALQNNDVESVLLLLDHGTRVDAKNNVNETPLQFAIQHFSGKKEDLYRICSSLLDHGASVNHRDCAGSTPLHTVVQARRDVRFVKLLVARGANIHLKNWHECSPLQLAVRMNLLPIARELLESGANANDVDVDGISVLAQALLSDALDYCEDDMVRYLLDNGADVNLEVNGDLPLIAALKRPFFLGGDDSELCRSLMLKHIAFLSARGMYVHEKIINWAQEYSVHEYESCRQELESMKSSKVCSESSVTYFDLLTKRHNALANCLRCKKIRIAISSNNYKMQFPKFAQQVEQNYWKGLERMQLIEKYQNLLHGAFLSVLPYEITIKISELLSDDDLIHILNTYYFN